MERRFIWQGCKRTYRDCAPVRKALNVAIHLVKRCAGNVQVAERGLDVKSGNRRSVCLFPLSLREDKPIRPKAERVARLRFDRFFLSVIGLRGSLERHGHAKGDSFLPFADLPFPFDPSVVGDEWSGLQVAPRALFQRKQGVPERVIVKSGVSFEHSPPAFRLPPAVVLPH